MSKKVDTSRYGRPEPAWRRPVKITGTDPESGDVLELWVVAPNTIEQGRIKDRTDSLVAMLVGYHEFDMQPSGPIPDQWVDKGLNATTLGTVAALEVMQQVAIPKMQSPRPVYEWMDLINAAITMDEAFAELTIELPMIRKKAIQEGNLEGAKGTGSQSSPPSGESSPIQS